MDLKFAIAYPYTVHLMLLVFNVSYVKMLNVLIPKGLATQPC